MKNYILGYIFHAGIHFRCVPEEYLLDWNPAMATVSGEFRIYSEEVPKYCTVHAGPHPPYILQNHSPIQKCVVCSDML